MFGVWFGCQYICLHKDFERAKFVHPMTALVNKVVVYAVLAFCGLITTPVMSNSGAESDRTWYGFGIGE